MSFSDMQRAYDNMCEPEYPDYRESEYLSDKMEERFRDSGDAYEYISESDGIDDCFFNVIDATNPAYDLRKLLNGFGLQPEQVQEAMELVTQSAMYRLAAHVKAEYEEKFNNYFDNNIEALLNDLNDPY